MTRAINFVLPFVLLAGSVIFTPAMAGSVSREGPRGGQFNRDTACTGGYHAGRCATDWAYTGPEGRTWSGERNTAYGPRRSAHYNTVTGPNGNTAHRGHVHRRW